MTLLGASTLLIKFLSVLCASALLISCPLCHNVVPTLRFSYQVDNAEPPVNKVLISCRNVGLFLRSMCGYISRFRCFLDCVILQPIMRHHSMSHNVLKDSRLHIRNLSRFFGCLGKIE